MYFCFSVSMLFKQKMIINTKNILGVKEKIKHKIQYNLLLFFLLIFSNSFATSERLRLVLTDNPATTVMIGWDQVSSINPIVYYGTSDQGTNWQSYSFSKEVDRVEIYKGMNNHFAKLTGLLADTNYYFVIKDEEGVSNRFWFRTAPSSNKALSFIAGGDSRNNRTPRQNANLLVSKFKPNAVFFGGDMTAGDSDIEWIEWFDDWQLTTASDGRMFPIIPARGNHEYKNKSVYNLFNVPSELNYYDITFGENLFTIYTLNTEISCGGEQVNWLNENLINNTSVWKSAQYHKPMRSHVTNKPEGNDQYNNWAELFYEYEVRLIIESDSHDVKTTWPIKPCSKQADCDEGFIRDDANGSVYIGEGCWGAPLRNSDDSKNWTRDSGSFNQFKWICVSEEKIEIKTILIKEYPFIEENSNTYICKIPIGVDIWNPTNGDTVTIAKTDQNKPYIHIISPTGENPLNNEDEIIIKAAVFNLQSNLNLVSFYVNRRFIGSKTIPPFQFTHNFKAGKNIISVTAISNDNQTYTDNVRVFVNSKDDSEFTIYPNPFSGSLFFTLPNLKHDYWYVSIYTLSGKRILSERIIDNQISTTQLSAGTYIVKVFNGNKERVFTRKIRLYN